jgi:hypothetical protein
MAAAQELQVQKKRELENKEETTIPARIFLPAADIYEAENDRRCDAIAGAGTCDEIRKLIRASAYIVFVKNSFRQPSKKARHAVF